MIFLSKNYFFKDVILYGLLHHIKVPCIIWVMRNNLALLAFTAAGLKAGYVKGLGIKSPREVFAAN